MTQQKNPPKSGGLKVYLWVLSYLYGRVAHRISTVENSGVIYVLSEGRLAEHGTHAELMAKHGVYSGLVLARNESA